VIGVLGGAAALGGTAQGATARPGRPGASGATDPSATAAAKQATVGVADLGPGWTRYRKASGFQKVDTKNCNVRFGSPVRPSDRGYNGVMLTDTAKRSFVYSYAFVFRTKAAAKAYTAVRGAPKFLACQAAKDAAAAKAAKGADPTTYVRIVRSTDPAIGGAQGLEAFYEEQAGTKAADGTDAVAAAYTRYTYRHGRVVTIVLIDTGLAADAAGSEELGTRLTAALTAGSDAIATRLTKLGL
jgi:hypothetical protein